MIAIQEQKKMEKAKLLASRKKSKVVTDNV